jgi:hypothetical protein
MTYHLLLPGSASKRSATQSINRLSFLMRMSKIRAVLWVSRPLPLGPLADASDVCNCSLLLLLVRSRPKVQSWKDSILAPQIMSACS